MPAGMTNYLKNALLDHVVGNTPYTSPTTVYAKMHTGDPGADATLLASTYTTRVAVSFGAPSARVCSNDATVDFNSVTLGAPETWGGVSIWDASTGGNPLFQGTLSATVDMENGDSFAFAIGDIDCSLGGAFTTYLANELLDHVLNNAAYAQPASLHVKAHLADPTVSGTVSPAAETTRAAAGAFSAAAAGATANTGLISWTSVSNTETWSHVTVHDAATAGNPLLFGALTASKAMTAGEDAEFAIGELDITFA